MSLRVYSADLVATVCWVGVGESNSEHFEWINRHCWLSLHTINLMLLLSE